MKEIKIFLASSEELEFERNAFGNLVRRLDEVYEKRGIRIRLFEWEDADAAYSSQGKQEEYDKKIKECDMFIALFYTKAGEFTLHEYDVATDSFLRCSSPKVYTYCKELKQGEQETLGLIKFKERLFKELKHYWCRYNNTDSMQLHFVMQLQLVENNRLDDLKVENGIVKIHELPIAKMDNLSFVSNNDDLQKMRHHIRKLHDEIICLQTEVEKNPLIGNLKIILQERLNEYRAFKDRLSHEYNNLLEMSKRISSLQDSAVTDRMYRAIEAFNEGKAFEARHILQDVERDSDLFLEELLKAEKNTEQKRDIVFKSIEELRLKMKSIMADVSSPIDKRIEDAYLICKRIDVMTDKTKFLSIKTNAAISILADCGNFLLNNGKYDDALAFEQKLLRVRKEQDTTSVNADDIAWSYDRLGRVFAAQQKYAAAIKYFYEALCIYEKTLGANHPTTAIIYNNIGGAYKDNNDFIESIIYFKKALPVFEKTYGTYHIITASCYNNIAQLHDLRDEDDEAQKYYELSCNVFEHLLGLKHLYTALAYNNLGLFYYKKRKFTLALLYINDALTIREEKLGIDHPMTAKTYKNIGGIYKKMAEDYVQTDKSKAANYRKKSIEYCSKALPIIRRTFGEQNDETICIKKIIDECK